MERIQIFGFRRGQAVEVEVKKSGTSIKTFSEKPIEILLDGKKLQIEPSAELV